MKKILSYIGICSIMLLITSCEKLLEQYPKDQIASETFWQTEKDVNLGVAGIYNVMMSRRSMNFGRCLWDGLSDIGWGYSDFNRGLIEATSGVGGPYTESYAGISRCNVFLENVDKATSVSQSVRNRAKGEALFLRADFYFTLTEFYGGVPVYLKPPTIDESMIAKSTKAEVVTQILADLDQAISLLPDEKYTGHAVKASALALKAQVLMHNERWAEAAAVAKQIMTSGKFSLYNNYKTLFLRTGQENNPEIIFSLRYLNPNAGNYAANSAPEMMWAHGHSLTPLQEFVDMFECTDGLPITSSPLYNPANYKLNRDPRMLFTIIDFPDYKAKGDPIGQTGETWAYFVGQANAYSVEKMVDWSFMPCSWALQSDQDYIRFRYAMVLLMYAECQNEAVGPDQSVYDAINEIRARPTVNMPPLPEGLEKAAMREKIRHERAVELGMEGLRYWDIKRWKTAETVIPSLKIPTGESRVFTAPKHYLWPFPQSEIDVNPNLVQNPDY